MRAIAASILIVAACGHAAPRGTTPPPTASAPVGPYAALRWVPADADYVLAVRRTGDAAIAARELVMVGAMLLDFDPAEAERALRKEVGVNLLAVDELKDAGVDPDGGLAIFSEGLSPTFAVALSDPQRAAAVIDQLRGDAVVEVSREQGVDVYSWLGQRDVHLHWAIADGWLFVHAEGTEEHEPELAWYRALRGAGGAFAQSPDVAAAIASGDARPGRAEPPPVIGVARVPALLARIKKLGADNACVAQVRALGRVFLSASIEPKDVRAALTLETPGADASKAALAPPPGWAAAREGAALQLEWTADLDRVLPIVGACDRYLARQLADSHVRAVAGFVHAFDPSSLDGRGAAWYAAHDTRLFDDKLDQVTGISLLSHKRVVGGVEVVDVSVPMMPKFAYARAATSVTAAIGDGLIDQIVAGAPGPGGHLGHVEVHPSGLSDDAWSQLSHAMFGSDAARAILRLKRWELGRLDLDARPGAIVLTAHARLH